MTGRFLNRTDAGQQLADCLWEYALRDDVIVLGLPRGGVPVAYEIARTLHLPLDICLVRKLGAPRQPELAMGAIGLGGVCVLNRGVVRSLRVSPYIIEAAMRREQQELERREHCYRGDRALPPIKDQVVLLVDDGLATGSTMRAAIATLRPYQPKELIVAVPIAPPSVCEALASEGVRVVCLLMPESLNAIGHWYEDFSQTTDEQVCELLKHVTDPPRH